MKYYILCSPILPQCHVWTLHSDHPNCLLCLLKSYSRPESVSYHPNLVNLAHTRTPLTLSQNIFAHSRCSLGEKASWGQLTLFTLCFSSLHGAMFFFEKWNFHPWKISEAASLHGCGLTACHIPETDAPWVFGQTSFPSSFEVESTQVRTPGQGWGLSSGLCGGFSGWELSCCNNICNHISTVQNLPLMPPNPPLSVRGWISAHVFRRVVASRFLCKVTSKFT